MVWYECEGRIRKSLRMYVNALNEHKPVILKLGGRTDLSERSDIISHRLEISIRKANDKIPSIYNLFKKKMHDFRFCDNLVEEIVMI